MGYFADLDVILTENLGKHYLVFAPWCNQCNRKMSILGYTPPNNLKAHCTNEQCSEWGKVINTIVNRKSKSG
jgi:hypothetical protein